MGRLKRIGIDGYLIEEGSNIFPFVKFQTNLNRTAINLASLVIRPLSSFISGRYYLSGPHNREATQVAAIYEDNISMQRHAVLVFNSDTNYEDAVITHSILTGQINPKGISQDDLRALLTRAFRYKKLFPKNRPKIRAYQP